MNHNTVGLVPMFTTILQILIYLASLYMFKIISNMPSKPANKPTANVRVRRASSSSHKRRSKHRDKDTDTASVITSSTSSTDVYETESRCPMRLFLNMLDSRRVDKGKKQCPLRRAQLWYTIPFCVLAVINLLLVVIALLGLASWRAVVQVETVLETYVRTQMAQIANEGAVVETTGKMVRSKDFGSRES